MSDATLTPVDQPRVTTKQAPPPVAEEVFRITPAQLETGPTPAPAAEPEPAPEKPPEAKAPEGEQIDTEETDAEGKPKKVAFEDLPPYVKRELTKARNKARAEANQRAEADRARKAAEERATSLAKSLEQATAKPPAPPAEPLVRPKRTDFETPEAFETALETWADDEAKRRATEAVEREKAAAEKKAADDKAAEEKKRAEAFVAEQVTAWNKRREAAFEKYPDYVEVAESDDVKITESMAAAVMQLENGPDVAYWLGKNTTEVDRIRAMSPGHQMLEIGRISERLAQPRPKISTAPAPITPAPTGGRTTDTGREPTMEEYAAKRGQQLQANRRGFYGQTRPN